MRHQNRIYEWLPFDLKLVFGDFLRAGFRGSLAVQVSSHCNSHTLCWSICTTDVANITQPSSE